MKKICSASDEYFMTFRLGVVTRVGGCTEEKKLNNSSGKQTVHSTDDLVDNYCGVNLQEEEGAAATEPNTEAYRATVVVKNS